MILKQIAENLKTARESRGLSQKQLANKAGVFPSVLRKFEESKFESGNAGISVNKFLRLVAALEDQELVLNIGEPIKKTRELAGISQLAMATRLGLIIHQYRSLEEQGSASLTNYLKAILACKSIKKSFSYDSVFVGDRPSNVFEEILPEEFFSFEVKNLDSWDKANVLIGRM